MIMMRRPISSSPTTSTSPVPVKSVKLSSSSDDPEICEKRSITDDQAWFLENMNISTQDLIGRYKQKLKSGINTRAKFSANLRSFALTMHFYSPKTYKFARKKFYTCLPHIRTIKNDIVMSR